MAKKTSTGRQGAGNDSAKPRGAGAGNGKSAAAGNAATVSSVAAAGAVPSGARGAPGSGTSDPLARARLAFAAGNVRAARSLAAQILASGPEAEREEAAAIRDRTRPDPRALITVAVVFLIILFAAWVAIFRAH